MADKSFRETFHEVHQRRVAEERRLEERRSAGIGFCSRCLATTSDESAGSTLTVSGVGDKLYGAKDRCDECGSVVKLKAWCYLFIPIFPRGHYRVISYQDGRYIGRKCQ